MAYETAGIVFLLIIILVAIIVVVLLIYYSCNVYNNEDYEDNDNLNDDQTDIQNNRQTRRNNVKKTLSNIQNPKLVVGIRNKKGVLQNSIFYDDELNRLLKPQKDINDEMNPIVDESFCLDDDSQKIDHSHIERLDSLVPKEIDEMNYQKISNDVFNRVKTYFDSINSKKNPDVMKITKKEPISNDVESGSLVQFEGFINYMLELPSNPENGLQLNLFNNSSVNQTINSKNPILNFKSSSLTKNLNVGKVLVIIYNGSEWITTYQSENTDVSTSNTSTNQDLKMSIENILDQNEEYTTTQTPPNIIISNKPNILPNVPSKSKSVKSSSTVKSSLLTIDEQIRNILDTGHIMS